MNFENPWFARIFSIVLALILFLFVNFENRTHFQSTEPTDGASIEGSEIIPNLPIEVNVDTDRYFVSGIPDSATLRIQGPQAVIFQTVATQSYTVTTPNLNELGEGEHTIELQVEGLSDNITWSVSPSIVTLEIEEKVMAEYPLDLEIDESLDLANGYEIVDPQLSTDTVQISGAASTMEQIDQVLVEISSNESDINSDFVMSAQVLVLDEESNPLNVNTDPNQVEINVPVVRTQKTVPIVLREGNGKQAGYQYELSLSSGEEESITVRGDSDAVSDLENFPVVVDLSGATESKVVSVPIDDYPEGIEEASRDEIEVLIEVTEINQNTTMND